MLAGGIVLLIIFIVIAGVMLGGEVGYFVAAGTPFMPLILLALVGVLGLRYELARWAGYGLAFLLQALTGLFTVSYAILGLAEGPIYTPDQMAQNFPPSAWTTLAVLMVVLVALFLLSLAVLFRVVRVRIAQWIPIDPDNYTHTIALWVVLYITTSAYAQLILLGGRPPLLTAISSGLFSEEALNARSSLGRNLDLIYGLIWMIPPALIAAGWPLRRTIGATLQRLGLVMPSWKQVVLALVGGLVLLLLMNGWEWLLNLVWQWVPLPRTDFEAFEQLLGSLVSPIGALAIGITAGLGEELAVRGLLQPRLGLVFSNLAFTAVHAYQYGFDSLLTVFILGMILGVVRMRTNTSTAAILHGTYNASVILVGALG